MTNEKKKRWFLEALYIVGMVLLLIAIIFIIPFNSIEGYLVMLGYILLAFFCFLYLKWFKIWNYDEIQEAKK